MTTEIAFELGKLFLAICAATFTYWKYFREGTHKQRVEFDIDCRDLGVRGSERVLEVGCSAENKGNVEQRFYDIRVNIRGIRIGKELEELSGHEPRLRFPEVLAEASLVKDKFIYYFVRPKVRQRFPLVIRVPVSCDLVLIRSTFRYKNTDDEHSAERAFTFKSAQAKAEPNVPPNGGQAAAKRRHLKSP